MASWALPESSGGLCTFTGAIASRERELVRGRRQSRERFLLGSMDFKNAQQVSQLQDGDRRLGKAVKDKAGTQVAGDLQTLHKRGDSGAVHVLHASHVDEKLRDTLVSDQGHQRLTDLGRVEKRNITRQVEYGYLAQMARGEFDWRT